MPHANDTAAVTAAIRAHYVGADPAPGQRVEPRPCGLYTLHDADPEIDSVLVDTAVADVAALLAEVHDVFGPRPARIYVDDPGLDARLRPALEAGGCRRTTQMLYLAHTGGTPDAAPVAGLGIRPATAPAHLRAYAAVRIQAFGETEHEPDPAELETETLELTRDLRRCRYWIGWLDDEAAAIAGCYEGPHRILFHLATRIPYRRRGIARALLTGVIRDSLARADHASLTIFTDPDDGPVDFYRAMGFAAEVYWQARYRHVP